jgi:spermidine dehydrogenase
MANQRHPDRGLNLPITRRDFCQGSAWAVSAASLPWVRQLLAADTAVTAHSASYPPALTGLRGAHVGSFETAHALAREERQWPRPEMQTDYDYDAVIVGAGLSGLSGAYFLQQELGTQARILLLDNHDDFGGHAKRNEFTVGKKRLLAYGGSESMENPSIYSDASKKLLRDLGVDVAYFYSAFDQRFAAKHRLRAGLFFDAAHYARDQLIVDEGLIPGDDGEHRSAAWLDSFPLDQGDREQLAELLYGKKDHLEGRTQEQKKALLGKISYRDYLLKHVAVSEAVAELFQASFSEIWGVHSDAISAIEHWRNGYPGFSGLGLSDRGDEEDDDQPYIFHFPDGNASLARLLVRRLIPAVANGNTMIDILQSAFDYTQLDCAEHTVRLRLNSTAVHVEQRGETVEVIYHRDGRTERVQAKHVILACYHVIIPHLCPQLPEAQKVALKQQVKVPLVCANVALKQWQGIKKSGVADCYCPQSYFPFVRLDYPVSMGDYRFASDSNDAIVLRMIRVPCMPKKGMAARDQHRIGRYELLSTSFEQFEQQIRQQLNAMYGASGFDAARDISAITVNRWPHGYAYEYNELFDPEYGPQQAPHHLARRAFGRIHIANSDAQARAYVDAAIDEAWRATAEIEA